MYLNKKEKELYNKTRQIEPTQDLYLNRLARSTDDLNISIEPTQDLYLNVWYLSKSYFAYN